MTRVTLTVNGVQVTAEVEPRTHLADFLREDRLLTATHIGCEHGVCGACTILLDGAPARSCIAFAAACEGADVRTLEGLEDDPVMQRLRAAFTAEHALQCGYCIPGMLVTARDIVLRLPDADEARIRLELAGNLCRCTGYAGIVRAIRRVLAEQARPAATPSPGRGPEGMATAAFWRPAAPPRTASATPSRSAPAALPTSPTASPPVAPPTPPHSMSARASPQRPAPTIRLATSLAAAAAPPTAAPQAGPALALAISLNRPRAEIWSALHDPALLAACVPGARLVREADGEIEGEMQVALGPITAVFAGTGRLVLDDASWQAALSGEGRDSRSNTHLSGSATITLEEAGAAATRALLSIHYALRGPLAQLARRPVVQALAGGIAETVGRNLERRLAGEISQADAEKLPAAGLLLRVVWQTLRRWLHRA